MREECPEGPVSRNSGREQSTHACMLHGLAIGATTSMKWFLQLGPAAPTAHPGSKPTRSASCGVTRGTCPAGGETPPAGRPIVRSADGTRIAYAVHGDGPPMLIAACWLTTASSTGRARCGGTSARLGGFATVIRYDERGHGCPTGTSPTSRWRLGWATWTPLPTPPGWTVRADGDVAGRARASRTRTATRARHPADLLRQVRPATAPPTRGHRARAYVRAHDQGGLGAAGGHVPRVFRIDDPGATEEQAGWLDDLQASVTRRETPCWPGQRKRADARALMPELSAPTLVLHSWRDRMSDFEQGRDLTAIFPAPAGAAGQRQPHPARRRAGLAGVVDEVGDFLAATGRRGEPAGALRSLTGRELDVLRSSRTAGTTGDRPALTLSVRTVERHLTSIYAKLDVTGRAARTAAVARLLAAS